MLALKAENISKQYRLGEVGTELFPMILTDFGIS